MRWQPSAGPAVELDHLAVYTFEDTYHSYSYPHAINASGTIVGTADAYYGSFPISRAVKWGAGGTSITQLQSFGGGVQNGQPGYAHAWGINDTDVSVGWATQYDPDFSSVGNQPVRWDAAGSITPLQNLSSYPIGDPVPIAHIADGAAYAINNSNVAVGHGVLYLGTVDGAQRGHRAVRWDAAGSATRLGDLGADPTGHTISEAWFINDAGNAVGYADKYDIEGNNDGPRAVRWNQGSTTALELETLGTAADGVSSTRVYALNDAEVSVGVANEYSGGLDQGSRAVLWDNSGQVTELAHFPSYEYSEAYDVNEAGMVVGIAQKEVTEFVATYWDTSGNPVDLNTLIAPGSGWSLYQALAISETGWIVGTGYYDPPGDQNAYERVFMLQVPVPVALAGDYNGDDTVDAADYTVWRDNLGTNVTLLNDTTPSSVIDYDYNVWRANFGATIGEAAFSAAGTNVPEPPALLLAALAATVALLRRSNVFC
jgi:hypothetical protein